MLSRWFAKRFDGWLNKRIPAAEQIQLGQKNIFIFPSRFGLAFLVMTLAIYLLGTNYSNNLALFLAFFLVSVFVGSIWHSYRNLAGLQLQAESATSGYVDETGLFSIKATAAQPHLQVALFYQQEEKRYLTLSAADAQRIAVPKLLLRRGSFAPGRLTVESFYPFGLFRTWTHLDLLQSTLVYPKPLACQLALQGVTSSAGVNDPQSHTSLGADEFDSLREYQQGESLRQVAWKQYAQGRGMLTKQFEQPEVSMCWLSLQRTPGQGIEEKLSRLCYRVLELSRQGSLFGLQLGAERIEPAVGEKHRLRCLKALALYGQEVSK